MEDDELSKLTKIFLFFFVVTSCPSYGKKIGYSISFSGKTRELKGGRFKSESYSFYYFNYIRNSLYMFGSLTPDDQVQILIGDKKKYFYFCSSLYRRRKYFNFFFIIYHAHYHTEWAASILHLRELIFSRFT